MKKSLLIVYILAVLVLAGVVRAETSAQDFSSLPIASADYQGDTGLLHLTGEMTSTCYGTPEPELVFANETSAQLILHSPQTKELCLPVVIGHYELAFDLRSLVQDKDVAIEVLIQTEDQGQISLVVDPSSTRGFFPLAEKQLKGRLFIEDNTAFIHTSSGEYYPVKNPKIDWQKNSGVNVVVIGFLLSHDLPVLDKAKVQESTPFFATGASFYPQL